MTSEKKSKIGTSNEVSHSSAEKGKDKPLKKKKNGEGIEEYIDPDPDQKSTGKGESNQPDGMGISEKAKRQSSDERDVARGKS